MVSLEHLARVAVHASEFGGLDVVANTDQYENVVRQLKEKGIEVSFFLDPDPEQIRVAHGIGGDIVEIHTGHYAEARSESEARERFERIVKAVDFSADLQLGISAGHGLNYVNIKRFENIPVSRSTA